MKIFDLRGTTAAQDITDDCHGVLVVKDGRPQLFVPYPADEPFSQSMINIDPKHAEEIASTTRVYGGFCSAGGTFIADALHFPHLQTIREARAFAGITQIGMAEELNIPLRTVEDWCSGKRQPPPLVERLIIEKLSLL